MVSDTPTQSLAELDKRRVADCARAGIGVLTELTTSLVSLSDDASSKVHSTLGTAECQRREELGLSVTQTHLWLRQVERLEALVGAERGVEIIQRLSATQRKAALHELVAAVDEQAISTLAGEP